MILFAEDLLFYSAVLDLKAIVQNDQLLQEKTIR